jgi:chemosensory pili system protein ChpC
MVSLPTAAAETDDVIRGSRARVVICFTPSGNSALPYIGILAIGPPRLARLTEQVLEPVPKTVDNPFVLHELIYSQEPAWIPDMDAIERAVLEATKP